MPLEQPFQTLPMLLVFTAVTTQLPLSLPAPAGHETSR